MKDFIRWAFCADRPIYIIVCALMAAICSAFALISLTVWTWSLGLWLPTVLIWIVAPVLILVNEYRDTKRDVKE